MEGKLRVGIITSTHGVKGEVKVFPTTSDMNRFKKLKQVTIFLQNKEERLTIEGVKFFKQYAILKFEGYDSIESIEKLKSVELWVDRQDAVKLDKNEYYIGDLIGIEVFLEDGSKFGTLTDVMQTGANDVYIVKTDEDKEVLLPAIKECIKSVSLEDNKMTVFIMEGLLD